MFIICFKKFRQSCGTAENRHYTRSTWRASVRWSSSPTFPSRSSTWQSTGHPRIRNLPSSIFDPPNHPNLPLSSPCPCCLSRCLILQPPQLVKLLKELTLPSSTDLKFSVAHNIVSLYRTTPYDLQFLLVIFSTERFMDYLVQDTSMISETAFSA